MRWQQNLRFGKSEEELKLKATNLKIVTDNEDQGTGNSEVSGS